MSNINDNGAVSSALLAVLMGGKTSPQALSIFSNEQLRRMRLFGGLVSKVQHGQLWGTIPQTLEILSIEKLDIPFFAKYRQNFASVEFTNLTEKTWNLLIEMRVFLKRTRRWPYTGIVAIFDHELAYAELTRRISPMQIAIKQKPSEFKGSTITLSPLCRMVRLNYAPDTVFERLKLGLKCIRNEQFFCYLYDGSTVKIHSVSPAAFLLLETLKKPILITRLITFWAPRLQLSQRALRAFLFDANEQGFCVIKGGR